MQGETYYILSEVERQQMMHWYQEKMLKKETCYNQKGHICMGSTTDHQCVKCWMENK